MHLADFRRGRVCRLTVVLGNGPGVCRAGDGSNAAQGLSLRADYSGLMPAIFSTFAHFTISALR